MAGFTDKTGTQRTIDLDVLTLMKIEDRFGINLMDLLNSQQSEKLTENFPLLMNIIGILSFPGMPDEEAAAALADNDVIAHSVDALLQALRDYLPARMQRLMKRAA